jgi:hypothetical protein
VFGFDLTRILVYGALALAVAAGLVGIGYHQGVKKLWDYRAAQAEAAVPIVVKQGKTTEKIVTRWRTRVEKVKGDTEVITKEITVYVPPSADPVLGVGWLWLHDASATRAIPKTATGVDVTAPAIAASQALKGVVANYGQCYGYAAQLIALQEWVRAQYQVMNLEELGY